MKLDGMNPAPPVTRTRLATSGRLRVWTPADYGEVVKGIPGPRSMPRDFQRTPVRVVIVDDHRLFVDALALLLNHDDRLDVIGTAGDGRAAIDLVISQNAEVAVIDVRMPEIDGLETARRLRKRSPETSVILVTGLDEPRLAEQAREAGAVALLTKGALHEELKEAIVAAANLRES
jgi:DNA-binding NarL/FixJ family response regulator